MTLRYPSVSTTAGRKSPTGRTLWCGPFAIAVVTGLSYDDAYKKLLSHIRREQKALRATKYRGLAKSDAEARLRRSLKQWPLPKTIRGTSGGELGRCLAKLGVPVKWTTIYRNNPTLITFAREHTVKGRTYIINAGHHWVVIKDGILYHSHHDPLAIDDAPRYKKALVKGWAEVRPRPLAVMKVE